MTHRYVEKSNTIYSLKSLDYNTPQNTRRIITRTESVEEKRSGERARERDPATYGVERYTRTMNPFDFV